MKSINRLYFLAFGAYVFPLLALGLFLVDQFWVQKTEMLFWLIFLVSLVPCGLFGMVISLIALLRAIKRKERMNTVIGIIGLAGGLLPIAGGIFGYLLLYVVLK
ncbi:MAG: hypothetical protein U0T73_08095 [Chitinophagales bacterium]